MSKIFSSLKYSNIRVLVHILFWGMYFSVFLLPGVLRGNRVEVLYFIVHFGVLISATYFNIYLLMRKYFFYDKYAKYIISLVLLWIVSLVIIILTQLLLQIPADSTKFIKFAIGAVITFTMGFFMLSLYKVAKEWYLKSKRTKEIELEKMQAELGLLRSQLDAHFLFNTLNNLYLLVLNKSDKAPDAILMLSDLLSYNIYESSKEKIPVSKELKFIGNYIALQKLRLNDKQEVSYNLGGDCSGDVEPFILFNFIENAFKHANGTISINGQDYYIYIKVNMQEDCLNLVIMNSYSATDRNPSTSGGVGLQNTIKRLDMAYADNYELDITNNKDEKHYKVSLTINTEL